MMPRRVKRERKKGWRMPENTVYVGRPTIWGNPWSVKGVREWLSSIGDADSFSDIQREQNCVYNYWLWVTKGLPVTKDRSEQLERLEELRGKNLACWCRLDRPCHADVLIALANGYVCEDVSSR